MTRVLLGFSSSSSAFSSLLAERADTARQHRQTLRTIAATDARFARAAIRTADDTGRQLVQEACQRAVADARAVLKDSWLAAVLAEEAVDPPESPEQDWRQELTADE